MSIPTPLEPVPDGSVEPADQEPSGTTEPERPRLRRRTALLEVVVCSGYPTQIVIGVILASLGLAMVGDSGELSLLWVVVLSIADAGLLLGLVFYFLLRNRDDPRALFLGSRPPRGELVLGALLIPLTLGSAAAVLALLHTVFPGIRNVLENPFETLLQSPSSAVMFAVVAVVAGGVREELQRAFILSRFEQYLGGAWVGLAIFSVAFGLGHYPQGWDAVVVTGLLGGFWGAVYLVRRSVVSTVFCHAGFNLAEILIALRSPAA